MQGYNESIMLSNARRLLLEARTADGIWQGRLSSSPLATAVAVFALHCADAAAHSELIDRGLGWLAAHQHPDGGWGDAEILDPPNLSSTLLCYAALNAINKEKYRTAVDSAARWLVQKAGGLEPDSLAKAVYRSYGTDRTFAVPILAMCALADVLGKNGWRYVKALPYELAVLPRCLFRWLNLTVVSYALPALIAIGQVKQHFSPSANIIVRGIRRFVTAPTQALLERLQPTHGGFLEAVPLTGFVLMSLAAMGLTGSKTAQKAAVFLCRSVRNDGSWPIDTNLSTWVTSLAVRALLEGQQTLLSESERLNIAQWYLDQQFRSRHIYTGASAGGWGWTNLPGAVPDADDTAGALITLHRLGIRSQPLLESVRNGVKWLLDMQNSDGGIPTFCRGWGKLEFDRSCPDITAHAVTAWQLWKDAFDSQFNHRIHSSIQKALCYLYSAQNKDGSWTPLWFGCPFSDRFENLIYGTSMVLQTLVLLEDYPLSSIMGKKGTEFLLDAQNKDGGWGAQKGYPSTVEETSLAIRSLIKMELTEAEENQIEQGLKWLTEQTKEGVCFKPKPIGLYFARLWYAEHLYPVIFLSGINGYAL
ncbi:MAG TPA: prenyltransferase/squalene oxidase repeat-containing protein [Anaerohalosphaeraceae bacterium]|nr:squalene--hopene cyclase [Phycisphaerae bacterium]HOK95281.1 prenyltransferase/squalene oxidase repeat-containing protein [Anaerohalosphaeraceae bacterium]HOL31868.1 prenyltransferase/squalene oxidase repeat-containing protein [Anaerohalosphaeraceae bacterium]HOM76709.1 prenyltransferase/squalene oxidase repeat-containing protein [Anaerohalosphaeraceae bacterium]HPC64404.1 prenyltransferase/squalene oxidase repeat-containing protein [Anaerohalosphaeraceae bacterium]